MKGKNMFLFKQNKICIVGLLLSFLTSLLTFSQEINKNELEKEIDRKIKEMSDFFTLNTKPSEKEFESFKQTRIEALKHLDEIELLNSQSPNLKNKLSGIKSRLDNISSKSNEEFSESSTLQELEAICYEYSRYLRSIRESTSAQRNTISNLSHAAKKIYFKVAPPHKSG